MPQPKPNNDNIPKFDLDTLKLWLDNQNLEIQTKHQENELRAKEIDANKELALQSMALQSEYLRGKPKEMRKNVTRLAWTVGGILALICGFILALLQLGKDEFAGKFLTVASHTVTLAMGYYFGRRVTKNKNQDSTNGEIIDN